MSLDRPPRPRRPEPFRVPGVVVPILCAAVGWVMAGLPGMVVAGVLGLAVWRLR